MDVGGQFAVVGQSGQRVAFEEEVVAVGQAFDKAAVEDEEAAADKPLRRQGFSWNSTTRPSSISSSPKRPAASPPPPLHAHFRRAG